MSLLFDGIMPKQIIYNSIGCKKVYYNNVLVWSYEEVNPSPEPDPNDNCDDNDCDDNDCTDCNGDCDCDCS